MKPACFSSVTVSDQSATCHKCPYRASCAEGAYAFLDQFRGRPTIDRERQRIAQVALVFSPVKKEAAIDGAKPVPVKPKPKGSATKRASDRREETGAFALAARELAAGRNPGKKPWEVVLFDLVLQGIATRKKLVRTYMEDPRTRYTYGSARTRACTALAMFQEALLLRETEEGIALHPRLQRDHKTNQEQQTQP